jgi:hypothetical protein
MAAAFSGAGAIGPAAIDVTAHKGQGDGGGAFVEYRCDPLIHPLAPEQADVALAGVELLNHPQALLKDGQNLIVIAELVLEKTLHQARAVGAAAVAEFGGEGAQLLA